MPVAVSHDSGVAILEWTQRDVGALAGELRKVLDGGDLCVLLDMSRVEYLKGDGFETLTEVLSLCERAGGVVGMFDVNKSVSILIDQLGLGTEFPPVLGKRADALERIREMKEEVEASAKAQSLDIAFENDSGDGADPGARHAAKVTDPEKRTFEIELDLEDDAAAAAASEAAGNNGDGTDALAIDFEGADYGPTMGGRSAGDANRPSSDDEADAVVLAEESDGSRISDELEDSLAVAFDDAAYSYRADEVEEESDEDIDLDMDELLPVEGHAAASAPTPAAPAPSAINLVDTRPMATVPAAAVPDDERDEVIDLDDVEPSPTPTAPTPPVPPTRSFTGQELEDTLAVDFDDHRTASAAAAAAAEESVAAAAAAAAAEPDDGFAAVESLDGLQAPPVPAEAAPVGPSDWSAQTKEDALGVDWDDAAGARADAHGPRRPEDVRVPGASEVDLAAAARQAQGVTQADDELFDGDRPTQKYDPLDTSISPPADVSNVALEETQRIPAAPMAPAKAKPGNIDNMAATQVIRSADLDTPPEDDGNFRKTEVLAAVDPTTLGPMPPAAKPSAPSGPAVTKKLLPWPAKPAKPATRQPSPPPPRRPTPTKPMAKPAAPAAGTVGAPDQFSEEDTVIIDADEAKTAEAVLTSPTPPAAPAPAPAPVGEGVTDLGDNPYAQMDEEESLIMQSDQLLAEVLRAVDDSGSPATDAADEVALDAGAVESATAFFGRLGIRHDAQLRILEYLLKLLPRVNVHTVRDVELGTGLGTGTAKSSLDQLGAAGLLQKQSAHTMFQRDTYRFEPDQALVAEAEQAMELYRSPQGNEQIQKWLASRGG